MDVNVNVTCRCFLYLAVFIECTSSTFQLSVTLLFYLAVGSACLSALVISRFFVYRLSFALVLSLACFILTHCCAVIPGLESFSFDYVVKWPVSLILSKKVSTKWNRVLKCDVIILLIFPFEPLSLIMRYTQLL